ncbi:Outer membrane protein OprJ [subsurface metagenome]
MRFPSFSITGALGAVSSDLTGLTSGDALIWSTAGGLTGPIFNFGKNKRRVQIERERAEQTLLAYEKTVLQAFREVEDALLRVQTVEREVEAIKRQLAASENAASLSRARYDGGVTSYLEVLETERSFYQADLALSDAYQRQLASYVQLYKALGGGWITDEEMSSAESE